MKQKEENKGETDAKISMISKGVRGAGYLFLLLSFQRLLTFGLNQLLLRTISPQLFGLGALHFELFVATVVFLSREVFSCFIHSFIHSFFFKKKY